MGARTAALSPYLMLFGPLSAVFLILARRWLLTTAAVGLTVATLAVQLPLSHRLGRCPTLRRRAPSHSQLISAWGGQILHLW